MHLVLLRETAPLAPDPATWLLPSLIVTALGGGLAALVARRIVLPLGALTRWLPNLDRDSPDALPATVTGRHDEIGALARSLEESHRRLREETERRRQSERLAALGRIATSLAHEIRNPAAAIRLHADLLSNEAGPESKDSIDLIRDEVDRITDLVNQWLFVARGAPPRTTPHDLVALTRRVLARLAPQFDHARVTATISGAESAMVDADGPRLEQVMRNLLLNAMQAMPEGGTIEEALANAAEALSGWLFVAVKENQDVPAPSVHHGRTYHRVEPDMDVTVPLLILWTRKKKGLTQNQMAEALGVSQQAYRKLEIPGKSNPRLKTLSRLCGTLGLELQLRPVA